MGLLCCFTGYTAQPSQHVQFRQQDDHLDIAPMGLGRGTATAPVSVNDLNPAALEANENAEDEIIRSPVSSHLLLKLPAGAPRVSEA